MSYTPKGTAVSGQKPGDCKVNVCDGAGNFVEVNDDNDPPEDGNLCTLNFCKDGLPQADFAPKGTVCGQNLICDGQGVCTGCVVDADCPGVNNECQTKQCQQGVCGFKFAAANTPVSSQTPGDCKLNVCDGQGNVITINDNTDKPVDNNQCTGDVCIQGVPSNPPLPKDTACSQNGGSVCNGQGQCVQCTAASQCPGTNDDCKTKTCTTGVCGFSFTPINTPVSSQTPGDCKLNVCDGQGNVTKINDNNDKPVDNNQCTGDVCTQGVPSNPPLPSGELCSQNGGQFCDGQGKCVQCVSDAQCPTISDPCKKAICKQGTCGIESLPDNTPIANQTPGNCAKEVCVGGLPVSIPDPSDIPPDDGNQCTLEVCSSQGPAFPPAPVGTGCDQKGGNVCDGNSNCIPTFVVARVGKGGVALTNSATETFLEEYTFNGVLLPVPTNPVLLPPAGANRLTLSGTATSEGNVSRSLDGKFVVIAGYDADVGTANISNSSSAVAPRAIARLDRTHTVDATTKFKTAFGGNNIRSACTTDGKQLWALGASGGLRTTLLGNTDDGVGPFSSPANNRFCHFYLGSFYATAAITPAGGSPFYTVYNTTDPIPLSAPQTATVLPGLSNANTQSPYSFVIFDTNGDGKPDLLYIADDRMAPNGGIYKWFSDNGGISWLPGTPALIPLGNFGARGLAGHLENKTVTLIATDAASSPNLIFKVVEDLSGLSAPVVTVVVKAAPNTIFRGVAIGPR